MSLTTIIIPQRTLVQLLPLSDILYLQTQNLYLHPSIYGPQQPVMSVSNNNNAGASSSPFAHSIPSNPNAYLQPQPQSIVGPQQQVISMNDNNNAGASSSPYGHSTPSNPNAHLQSQTQSIFRRQRPSASPITNLVQVSRPYTLALIRAKTKDQAIAIAHAQLKAQLQAINQSQYASPDQAQANNAHNSGGNSVNSGGNSSKDCNLLQGQSSSTHTNVDEERINESNPSPKRARMDLIKQVMVNLFRKNETALSPSSNNGADHAGVTTNGSVTATTELEIDAKKKTGFAENIPESNGNNKSYNVPLSNLGNRSNIMPRNALADSTKRCLDLLRGPDGELPHKLRNLEPRFIEQISNEIMDVDPNVRWDDIAGLHQAKKCVNEMVIWPLLRPDIFKGCRSPGRGLLLFGPPGTGKTMIGKAIAGEAKATFFYISASSITSKWVGESEKLVRALFGVASCRQPAVIFVDEIDSLLSKRSSDSEHESSRRLKTQFLIEMEGFNSGSEQVLFIGATNRPQDLDEAARRRLTKRFYIPLPSSEARASIVRNVLNKDDLFKLSSEDMDSICKLTQGYSGSDMTNLVKDASMGPIREALRQGADITKLNKEDMRPVSLQDFEDALKEVRPSVSVNELGTYEDWNNQFGSLKTSSN